MTADTIHRKSFSLENSKRNSGIIFNRSKILIVIPVSDILMSATRIEANVCNRSTIVIAKSVITFSAASFNFN